MPTLPVTSPSVPRPSELRLVYQPIVDLRDGHTWSAEALVRWLRPDGRIVLPDGFLAAVAAAGQMTELSDEVMRRAFAELRTWRGDEDRDGWRLTVNIAAAELRSTTLVDRVATALERMDMDPGRLVVDVTDSSTLELAVARPALYGLRDLGVTVGLDDIGVGTDALARLGDLPASVVKLPQRFLDGLGHDGPTSTAAHEVVSLAGDLGVEVVADGVETDAQRQALVRAGIRYAQGFLFSRPVPHALGDGRPREAAVSRPGAGGVGGMLGDLALVGPVPNNELVAVARALVGAA